MSKVTDRESNASSSHEDDSYSDDDEGSSFAGGASVDAKQSELKQMQQLSRWETRGVRFWRTIVLILLIIAGALVSVGTYIFLSDAEKNDTTNRVRRSACTSGLQRKRESKYHLRRRSSLTYSFIPFLSLVLLVYANNLRCDRLSHYQHARSGACAQ